MEMDNLPTKEKLMTVTEVSEIFEVHQTTVLKYVSKIFPEKIKSGIKTYLNEVEVTKIKLELQQNQHLSQSSTLPKTELEENLLVLQAQNILSYRIKKLKEEVEYQANRIEEQQTKLKEAQPKIEFHNELIESDGLYSIGETAKLLGTGRTRLFMKLRELKIFFNTEPYQSFKERGYFEVKTTTKNSHVQTQAFVTPKGLEWLNKKLKSDGDFQTSF